MGIKNNPKGKTNLQAQQQNLGRVLALALEGFDDIGSVRMTHSSIKPYKWEAIVSHEGLDDGEERCELRDDNNLVIRMISLDPEHLLESSVDLAAGDCDLNVLHVSFSLL